MKISVVSTLYKSLPFLETFIGKMTQVLNDIEVSDYELLFVNDGSPDASLIFLLNKQKDNSHIRIVDLSRNFGHHYAIQVGLQYAKGDYVYLADNDMETPVDFLRSCYDEMLKDETLDFVYGVQESRKGHFVEKWGGKIFWSTFNALSEVPVPANILTECLMSRKFINELLRLNDANLFLAGMMHWVGLNKKELVVKKGQREGKSTYTFRKRLALMVQALTSFSGKPLEWLFYIGMSMTGMSLLFIIYLLGKKLLLGNAVSIGWTSLIGVNLFTLGVITTFLGLIGLYVFRIYKQVQGRPNAIVKKVY